MKLPITSKTFAGLSASIILSTILTPHEVHASVFDLGFTNIGHARVDPILNQQCLSDHMHTFYGGKSLWPTTSFDDLVALNASETSGPIEENKSLYWHPSIYHVDENGNYQIQETTMNVYYIWDPADPNVTAFSPGFAMIAGRGGADRRAEYDMTCNDTAARSFFHPEPCTNGEFNIHFRMPNCWNGKDRTPSDDHVTYSQGGGNEVSDPCPDGFTKIPQLWIFINLLSEYKGGTYMFADGSQKLHIDYLNGWEEGTLEQALLNCDTGIMDPVGGSACPQQFTYKDDEDRDIAPFPTTTEISAEAVTNIPSLQRKSPLTSAGNCSAGDEPLSVSPPSKLTPSPTLSPTAVPTPSAATPLPTAAPSFRPTLSPTMSPTRSPTAWPTPSPTTRQPTFAPSLRPTQSPTTVIPTRFPTTTPTSSPTDAPSHSPTAAPTPLPTTVMPSSSPTARPSSNTASPSESILPCDAQACFVAFDECMGHVQTYCDGQILDCGELCLVEEDEVNHDACFDGCHDQFDDCMIMGFGICEDAELDCLAVCVEP